MLGQMYREAYGRMDGWTPRGSGWGCWRPAAGGRPAAAAAGGWPRRTARPCTVHDAPLYCITARADPLARSLDDANIDYFYLYTVASRFNLVAVRP